MGLSNSQYNEIMREYDQIRSYHQNALQARKKKLYSRIPELEQIEKEKTVTAIKSMRSLVKGEAASSDELKKRLSALEADKQEILAKYGLRPDILELDYSCLKCKDTGMIGQHKCSCFKQREINILYRQSNLTQVLEEENFDTFELGWYSDQAAAGKKSPRQNMYENVSFIMEMIANFEGGGQSLLLTGPAGTGKTFLTHCIAKALMDRGFSVVYFSAEGLFDLLSGRTMHGDDGDDEQIDLRHIYDCDLLIIDDLGTEFTNNFTIPQLFACMNERERNKKSVVISTNLSMGQIQNRYSERISSRMIADYRILQLYGDDIRVKKALSKS